MIEVEELQGFENACRLCLTTEETRSSIFGAGNTSDPLIDKILNCLDIEIAQDDKLSTLICISCVNKVNQWHKYKESCLESQDKLTKWWASQSVPIAIINVKKEPVSQDSVEEVSPILDKDTDPKKSPKKQEVPSTDLPIQIEDEISDKDKPEMILKENEPSAPETQMDITVEKNAENLENSESDNVENHMEVDQEPKELELPLVERETRGSSKRRLSKDTGNEKKRFSSVPVKIEPPDDFEIDLDESPDLESGELLRNPLASASKHSNLPETTSLQKIGALKSKKKIRRGPHTHFRGARIFKRKCLHCQINLHSKYSYAKHMARFHSLVGKPNPQTEPEPPASTVEEPEELIEDVEEELENLGEDASLTPVQQNIISQLKTFSCYSCEQSFQDRRNTLNHIRQHMPDLRAFTCVACLTEFPDRPSFKQHCEASFECAMKIALVVPDQGTEKYFTCNMCQKPMASRKDLLSHLSKHSDKQYEELMQPPPKLSPMAPLSSRTSTSPSKTPGTSPSKPPTTPLASKSLPAPASKTAPLSPKTSFGPYGNGEPAFNNECDLCGMIYRYKPNMIKHRELCASLKPESRTSYKCVDCGMTFLVFSKFHSHVTIEHKKKELKCPKCSAKFRSPSDYLTHHEFHRDPKKPELPALDKLEPKKFPCNLCNKNFTSRAELTDHRNVHLKVKIYSCVICRSMFSSAGALEIHMKDHGIEDPNERTLNSSCLEYGQEIQGQENPGTNNSGTRNECFDCGKTFSNIANLRRHVRNAHGEERRMDCAQCPRTFKNKESFDEHMRNSHNSPEKTVITCPECPKTFVFQVNLDLHMKNQHANQVKGNHECEICGKTFVEENSLKIHRGWHNRANSRFSVGNSENSRLDNYRVDNSRVDNYRGENSRVDSYRGENSRVDNYRIENPRLDSYRAEIPSSSKPAKARKSFPNQPVQQQLVELQCQVCDDKFLDVADLRKHVWDVHCARTTKPEKPFLQDDLQCELCTNVFPDEESLESHMEWHERNPILSDTNNFKCDICDKYYSTRKILWKHKKLHKLPQASAIPSFSNFQNLPIKKYPCNPCGKSFTAESSLKRHQVSSPECQTFYPRGSGGSGFSQERQEEVSKKRPVTCHICKTVFPSMSVLYQHKQLAHKGNFRERTSSEDFAPLASVEGVSCNICGKQFSGVSNLKQHFTIKHKNVSQHPCTIVNCKMVFSTPHALKNHELTHSNMIYSCSLCERHFFNKGVVDKHMFNAHRAVYQVIGAEKDSLYKETDLSTYVVKGATGTVCPRCQIKYPNIKAMKIHYFKFHETFG